jgi:hypothetical protein
MYAFIQQLICFENQFKNLKKVKLWIKDIEESNYLIKRNLWRIWLKNPLMRIILFKLTNQLIGLIFLIDINIQKTQHSLFWKALKIRFIKYRSDIHMGDQIFFFMIHNGIFKIKLFHQVLRIYFVMIHNSKWAVLLERESAALILTYECSEKANHHWTK